MVDIPRLARRGAPPHPGIVHLGPGAFFRAFCAVYAQDAMEARGGDWGIVAVSFHSSTARGQLVPQGCVFTSVCLEPGRAAHRIVGSITDVLFAPDAPDAVLAAMVAPSTKIVSMTITEKGYCHEPSTGHLDFAHPDIRHDLEHPDRPRSAPGFIVEALARRRAAGRRPFTVLSCDNLPANGELTQGLVVALANARDPALADWIASETPFPSSMVDRITPATTETLVKRLEEEAGYFDPACVQHEPFRQWVIEDRFVDGVRPHWEAGGAQFVSNVTAHEAMKLRCLNGTHSALAYLGYLAGFDTISETVGDPAFRDFCWRLWRGEIIPTLEPPEGQDLLAYCEVLMERYRNPEIRHRTWQIAMDGSQKLPQRILGTVADNLLAGRSVTGLALVVAGWMRYAGGVDERGSPIDVRDPLAETLRRASDSAHSARGKVEALMDIPAIFDAEIAAHTGFRDEVVAAYEDLVTEGARSAVAKWLQG